MIKRKTFLKAFALFVVKSFFIWCFIFLSIETVYGTGLHWKWHEKIEEGVLIGRGGIPKTHYYFLGVPVVSGNVVYSFTRSTLYAINDLGNRASLKWKYPLPSRPDFAQTRHLSNIILHNDIIYIGLRSGVFALNAETGKLLWIKPMAWERCHYLSLNPGDNILYGADGAYVKALDLNDNGKQIWKRGPFAKNYILSISELSDNTIYLGSDDYKVYAIDSETGNVKWTLATGRQVKSTPVRAGDIVYFGSNDGKVYAVRDRGHSCSLVWTYPTGTYVRSTPAVKDGIVYIGSYDRYFYALDAKTGYLVWKFKTGKNVDTRAIVDEGKVYFIGNDGVFYCLDTKNGDFLWRYSYNDNDSGMLITSYQSTSVTLANKRIYFNGGWWSRAESNYLYCIDLTYPTSDTTPPTVCLYKEDMPPSYHLAVGHDVPFFCIAQDAGGLGVKEVKLIVTGGPSGRQVINCERLDCGYGQWVGYVAGSEVTEAGITCQFEAIDAAGNRGTSGSESFPAFVETVPGPGWYPGDIHTHPDTKPFKTYYNALKNGLAWMCTTPHAANIEQELSLRASRPVFIWMPGTEVPLTETRHRYAHNLALNGKHTHNIDCDDIEWLTQHYNDGGVSYFAHGEFSKGIPQDMVPGLGTIWLGMDQIMDIDWYNLLNEGHKIYTVRGADSVRPYPYTYLYVEKLTRENIIDALKKGHNYCTYRPPVQMDFRINGALMGDTINVPKGAKVIFALSFSSTNDFHKILALIHNGEEKTSWRCAQGKTFHKEIEFEIEHSGWYVFKSNGWYIHKSSKKKDLLYSKRIAATTSNPIWVNVGPEDNTSPTSPAITIHEETSDALDFSFISYDPESYVLEYQYAIGTNAENPTDIVNWTSVKRLTHVEKTGLSLDRSKKYYLAIKARNGMDMWSQAVVKLENLMQSIDSTDVKKIYKKE